jgi:hypothetical protein
MAPWINRTLIQAARNGTASFTVGFTPAAAGSLLVAVAGGAISGSVGAGANLTTPSGWTLPTGGSAVGFAGGYVWWKTASGGESSLTTTSNGTDYPAGFVVYEFATGSSFLGAISAIGMHYSGAPLPTLTGISGSYVGFGLVVDKEGTGEIAQTCTWTTIGVIADTAVAVVHDGIRVGYALGVGYIEGRTGDFTPTFHSNAGTESKVGITFAINNGISPLAVSAGADQSIYIGTVANLTGSYTGGDHTSITYAWTQVSGPTGTFSSTNTAPTSFTPSDIGVCVLRLSATQTGATVTADVTVAVNAAPTTVNAVAVNSSTGWTPIGGTVLAVLADNDNATYLITDVGPVNTLLDLQLGALNAPNAGQDFLVNVICDKVSATTGTLVCRLYEGIALRSTVTVNVPDTSSMVQVVFPSSEISAISVGSWVTGLKLTLSATAS